MSIRLDPRRLNALKHLAGEAGVRPGDLVRQWVEERIDGSRVGDDGLTLDGRLKALEQRVAALESPTVDTPASQTGGSVEAAAVGTEPVPEKAPKARRRTVSAGPSKRVALHDEMIALIRERGPMTAAELAAVITERGRYAPPRSGKPLDAAMVSQRVSNPTYRARFERREGRIGLAE